VVFGTDAFLRRDLKKLRKEDLFESSCFSALPLVVAPMLFRRRRNLVNMVDEDEIEDST
jgi:ribosomal protein L19E